jgi:putative membrane protein
MKRVLLFAALLPTPAFAHGGHAVAPGMLLAEWRPDFLVAALLAVATVLYGRGLARLWDRAGRGRGVGRWEATAFAAGMAILALALLSPLETLTGTLLTAHMIQHMLLIAVAPPLLLLGRPDAIFPFAAPALTRLALVLSAMRRLARPLPAATLHAFAVWIWHAPGPFQAALASEAAHDLEHASFLLTALLFWLSIIAAARSRVALIGAIAATLVTLIQGGFLGALITLAGRPLYPAYTGAELWGPSPLEDQQLAGLVMWVPMGAIYLIAGLVLAAHLIGKDEPTSMTAATTTGGKRPVRLVQGSP